MSNKKIFKTIKSTVQAFLPDAKVLLFGSRARGDAGIDSDFDVLVITKNEFKDREKINWQGKIRKALINALDAPFDILVNSEEDLSKKGKLPGHLLRTASKEGVFL
ncbi:MAG: nucleotidyltransferase domain-containing protein [Bacteroidetes bacterium]|nr:nucleotidyltransferase domain-containing protein [Bacteroidota bacterium]